MKRNLLLAFLLVGLVVVEWGCKDCPDAQAIPSRLIGYKVDVQQYKDSSYTNTHFWFHSLSEMVQSFTPSTMLYATVGPFGCDVDEDYPDIITRLDSFSAISSIPYNGSLIVTNLFNQKNAYQTLLPIDLSKFHNGGWLYLNKAPIELDTFQFTFQFFDTEGNVFETTTDPIIITP